MLSPPRAKVRLFIDHLAQQFAIPSILASKRRQGS
jgi:hypothetical protein